MKFLSNKEAKEKERALIEEVQRLDNLIEKEQDTLSKIWELRSLANQNLRTFQKNHPMTAV